MITEAACRESIPPSPRSVILFRYHQCRITLNPSGFLIIYEAKTDVYSVYQRHRSTSTWLSLAEPVELAGVLLVIWASRLILHGNSDDHFLITDLYHILLNY
ncbi:MAG: hypothetical protein J07HQW2_00501 [Haloquadratum walsbyi J07HQW2]|jgi:hypothetical protein|uniref:Uncharacterized protein n=1 Tax=Haloquadratum walsbyi J07HQW2 TaxID=1238425 RepID=U1PK64_9EURY|nr:MAG: hypothetical protein J07HQW2_00501 [Haloquadratum walsbyi J07HQW2]